MGALQIKAKAKATAQSGYKYDRIREAIRSQIQSGLYQPGEMLPTDKIFSKQFHAGQKTIERALNALVQEGLVVRRRGSGSYVAQRTHPPLIPGRMLNIGILWKLSVLPHQYEKSFFGQITRGALSVLGLDEMDPQWTSKKEKHVTGLDLKSIERGIRVRVMGESTLSQVRHPPLRMVQKENFDGVLTVGILDPVWLEKVTDLGLPAVLADVSDERFDHRADQVFVDPQSSYREAVGYFVGQGCKRIHFVGGFTSIPAPSAKMSQKEVAEFRKGRMQIDPDSFLRLSAYRQAMDKYGLEVPESFVHFRNPYFVKAEQLAEELALLPEAVRPEAVVCHGQDQAEAMIEVFQRKGLGILAAGTTDQDYEGPALPIRAHGQELGAAAAELLISKLQRPGRLHLRVGVPMVFNPSSEKPNRSKVDLRTKG